MLAALAGFENKTDKYVMQRLIRAGDVNAKNKEVCNAQLWYFHYFIRPFNCRQTRKQVSSF